MFDVSKITVFSVVIKDALGADVNQESNQEKKRKREEEILLTMRNNPRITIKDLQGIMGLSESGVKKIIRQLRNAGLVERVGSTKSGYWKVINNE